MGCCPTLQLLKNHLSPFYPSIPLSSSSKFKSNELSNIPNIISKLSLDDYKACQNLLDCHYDPMNYIDNQELLLLFQLIAVRLKTSLSNQIRYHEKYPWIKMSWIRAVVLSNSQFTINDEKNIFIKDYENDNLNSKSIAINEDDSKNGCNDHDNVNIKSNENHLNHHSLLFEELLKLLQSRGMIKRRQLFQVSILESIIVLITKYSISLSPFFNSDESKENGNETETKTKGKRDLLSIFINMANKETDDLTLHRIRNVIIALHDQGVSIVKKLSLLNFSKIKYQILIDILEKSSHNSKNDDNQNDLLQETNGNTEYQYSFSLNNPIVDIPSLLIEMRNELYEASHKYPTQIAEIYIFAIGKYNLMNHFLNEIIKFPLGRVLFNRLVKSLSPCKIKDLINGFKHFLNCEVNQDENGQNEWNSQNKKETEKMENTLIESKFPFTNDNFNDFILISSNFFTFLKYHKTQISFHGKFLNFCLESSSKDLQLSAIDYICHNYKREFESLLLNVIFNMMFDSICHDRQCLIVSLRHLLFPLSLPISNLLNSIEEKEKETKESYRQSLLMIRSSMRQLALENLEFSHSFGKLDLCLSILKLTGLSSDSSLFTPSNPSVTPIFVSFSSFNNNIQSERGNLEISFRNSLINLMIYNPFHDVQGSAYEILLDNNIHLDNSFKNLVSSLLNSPRECISEGVAFVSKLYHDHQGIWDFLSNELEIRVNGLIQFGFTDHEKLLNFNPNPTLNCLYKLLEFNKEAKNDEDSSSSPPFHSNSLILNDSRIHELANSIKRLMIFVSGERIFSSCPEVHHLDDDLISSSSSSSISLDKLFITLCWRAIKIGALLLSRISTEILSFNEKFIMDITRFLIDQLLELRHPGAFCSLEEPLAKVSLLLPLPSRHFLLRETMEKCLLQPRIETTRRSAGLPIAIKSLIAENRELHLIIDPILELLKSSFPSPSDSTLIHSLNILRAIGRDSKFSYSPMYEGSILGIVFEYMKSPWNWPIRNGAMMLFSTWIQTTLPDHDGGKERQKEIREMKKWNSLEQSTRLIIKNQIDLVQQSNHSSLSREKGIDKQDQQLENSFSIALLIIFDRIRDLPQDLIDSLWNFVLKLFDQHVNNINNTNNGSYDKLFKMTARIASIHCKEKLMEMIKKKDYQNYFNSENQETIPSFNLLIGLSELLLICNENRDCFLYSLKQTFPQIDWINNSLPSKLRINLFLLSFPSDHSILSQSQFYLEDNLDLMILMTEKCPLTLESLEIIKHDQYLLSIFLNLAIKRNLNLESCQIIQKDNDYSQFLHLISRYVSF